MADLRTKKVQAINIVENGTKSGPALTRARATVPALQSAAKQYADAVFNTIGGRRADPVTRVEQRRGPNPALSPEGIKGALRDARTQFEAAANGHLEQAHAELNAATELHQTV